MTVPLDRLYHYFDDLINHDLIIYRYLPHGRKNLENLSVLHNYPPHDRVRAPVVIFSDQEPLAVDQFSPDAIEQYTRKKWKQLIFTDLHPDLINFTKSRNALFLCNGSIFDSLILVHSEVNSLELDFYKNLGVITSYLWSHAIIAKDWYRYAQLSPTIKIKHSLPPFDFLIYNRAWQGSREYRLKFLELVINKGLLGHCKTSFSPNDNGVRFTDHVFKNSNLSLSRFDLDKLVKPNSFEPGSSADFVIEDIS